ncbi:IS110 family transposase [Micromonospora sp. WMMA1363]|uniref:IS110 family transposase n=1 Tax=Micromonospora sp. WMMA1363 TaxID=3053985 RepID=UPI00259CE529|nr:IS110 family transposase [Micromonospora sp. WMMA1363]MDM4723355.1 IS110 family transposase [Micromonospora sp. WMMA1363]
MSRGNYYCGIDWAEKHLDYAVINGQGHTLAEGRIGHDPAGVNELFQAFRVAARRRKAVQVAIETDRGAFVAALRAAGQQVTVLDPSKVARYRGRRTAHGGKSDRADARMLAQVLRWGGDELRPLPASSPAALAIRELARAQVEAGRQRWIVACQIRSLLREFHGHAFGAWSGRQGGPNGLLRPEVRAVLAVAPTPAHARRLSRQQLRAALEASGRKRLLDREADRLHALFRSPALRHPAPVEDAMGERILALLHVLNRACECTDDLTARLAERFHTHPHAPIYASFPGLGPVLGARLLGEFGDDPTRFADARARAAWAGASPITIASGASHAVRRRRHANSILMGAAFHWPFAALSRSPGARMHYDRRREAGDRHATALRNLYRRLVSQLHHCLMTGEAYDEARAYPAHEIEAGGDGDR